MSIDLKNPQKPYGPVEIHDLIVEVKPDLCIGASACLMASRTFTLNDDAKAVILDSADKDDRDAIIDAARNCPTLAIKVKTKTGETIVE